MGYPGKRLFDLIGSVVVLLLASPLMVLAALVVAIRMGRPVLFKQERPGFNETLFHIYKFRTMKHFRNEMDEPSSDRDRLTGLGRFLRETSLDELPNLFNVVKGEMSLVGPRPLIQEKGMCSSELEKRRFAMRPGITGWAQVNGRNSISREQRLEYDAWYVEHCSLALDVKILIMTVFVVLRCANVRADSADVLRRREKPLAADPSSLKTSL